MTTYGVQPTGFVRKSLQDLLAGREDANAAIFGDGLIQTAASPMGAINGLLSDAEAELWELAEAVYRSFDPTQSEGVRLDDIGRLRLLTRLDGEGDDSFALAITNAGKANVRDADFIRAVRSVDGVTWARVYVNSSGQADEHGIAPNTVCVAALGGSDEDVALVVDRHVVPGIAAFGNTRIDIDVGGYCRTLSIQRPREVRTKLAVTVSKLNDRNGCPPPPNDTIARAIAAAFTGDSRIGPGETLTSHPLRIALAPFPTVELRAVEIQRDGGAYLAPPVTYAFDEIAAVTSGDVTVTVDNG